MIISIDLDDLDDNDGFAFDDPTRPTRPETLAECVAKWAASPGESVGSELDPERSPDSQSQNSHVRSDEKP